MIYSGPKARFQHLFPHSKILEGNVLQVDFDILVDDAVQQISLCIPRNFENCYAWSETADIDLSELISKVQSEMNLHREPATMKFYEKVIIFINTLKDEILQSIYGIDISMNSITSPLRDIKPYSGIEDALWGIIKSKYHNLSLKPIKIITYGTRFYETPPEEVNETFDASILRGTHFVDQSCDMERVKKELGKLRGTDSVIQTDVRYAPMFEDFVASIVNYIECNQDKANLCIAVTCRAGHHRSVAVAEMLKNIYPQITTIHYTIYQ